MGRFFVETHLSYENIMADFEKVLMDMKS
jgi:hypothetical protein